MSLWVFFYFLSIRDFFIAVPDGIGMSYEQDTVCPRSRGIDESLLLSLATSSYCAGKTLKFLEYWICCDQKGS